jgi:hypothetical protein
LLNLTLALDAAPVGKVLDDMRARMEDVSPWARGVPAILRKGAGSIGEQIDRRTFLSASGGAAPWQDAPYQRGKLDPDEYILLDAMEGRNAASVTSVTATGAGIGVRDIVLRQLYAAAGNGILSTANYARTLTGGFGESPGVYRAKPAKGIQRSGRPRRNLRSDRPRPRNITRWSAGQAMYWKLGLTYDFWPTEAELRAGIPSYPRTVGLNPVLVGRVRRALLEHVVGKDRLARGAALDPRRLAA